MAQIITAEEAKKELSKSIVNMYEDLCYACDEAIWHSIRNYNNWARIVLPGLCNQAVIDKLYDHLTELGYEVNFDGEVALVIRW